MQKLAVFLGQFAFAAAEYSSLYVAIMTYGAKGCFDKDKKHEEVVPTKAVLTDVMKMADNYAMGTCQKKTENGTLVSSKVTCTDQFLVATHYSGSDTCAGTPSSTMSFICMKDDSTEKWTSIWCDRDWTGFYEMQKSEYSSADCAGDPSASFGYATEIDDLNCVPKADLSDNTWSPKSQKTTKSGEVLTVQEFTTLDCSGTSNDTKTTCGACEVHDGKNVIVTCGGRVMYASGAAQPSFILPALIFLVVVAK